MARRIVSSLKGLWLESLEIAEISSHIFVIYYIYKFTSHIFTPFEFYFFIYSEKGPNLIFLSFLKKISIQSKKTNNVISFSVLPLAQC